MCPIDDMPHIVFRPLRYSRRNREHQKRYVEKAVKQYSLPLNKATDADIIDRLDSVENRLGYIKSLIRDDIARGVQ